MYRLHLVYFKICRQGYQSALMIQVSQVYSKQNLICCKLLIADFQSVILLQNEFEPSIHIYLIEDMYMRTMNAAAVALIMSISSLSLSCGQLNHLHNKQFRCVLHPMITC